MIANKAGCAVYEDCRRVVWFTSFFRMSSTLIIEPALMYEKFFMRSPVRILVRAPDILTDVFRGFSKFLQENSMIVVTTSVRPRPLYPTSFASHC